MTLRFPNESEEYRKARDELLQAERGLRDHIERVAQQRRALPSGGLLKEDYVFEELVDGQVTETRFSDLFGEDHDTLFVYSFMYAPSMTSACPSCTSIMDGLDGQVRHLDQNISTAIVAKHDIHTFHEHGASRGWSRLRLLSSEKNSYQADYLGESDGRQITIGNVFHRQGREIRHFWGSELVYHPLEGGHPRHVDLIWPLWNVLDLTPGGRGNFGPRLSYEDSGRS